MAINRENVIRAAEKYVSRGKLEAAIKEYRKVLAENPNDANTLNRVGDLYARIERFDEAVKLFSQIAEQYTRDGFFVKAIAIYKKIIKLDPTSLTVYERLAELYHKQGLLNEARTQYQVLADYYQKHDNAASAITIYQRMAELEPDNPTFHLKLAELFESQRLIDKATREYRLLADLLIVGGSVEEAVQVYLKALEISNNDLDFVREAISGLHDAGHVGEAARVLARAVELNPEASNLAQQIGLGEEPEEVEEIEPAPEQVPGSQTEAFAAAFEEDDTFQVPEASFDEIQDSLEETHASAAEAAEAMATPDDGDDTFTFDLDDDEVPSSLVTPPADMLDGEASAAPHDAVGQDAAGLDSVGQDSGVQDAVGQEAFELDDAEEEFDLGTFGEVDLEDETSAAGDTATGEIEIDWPTDEISDLDLPVEIASEASAGPSFDLDETMPGQRAEAASQPLEPEAFEIGDLDLEPVEHDLDIDLEPIEIEGGGEHTDFLGADETLVEEAAEVHQAPFDERREEDLLAEAKVFAKYGLSDKARDRLSELFQIRAEHLEGLDLQARLDLEAEKHQDVVSTANQVALGAAAEGRLEIWEDLRQTLTKAGYSVGTDRVLGEPGAPVASQEPAAPEPEAPPVSDNRDDRIAQLLDDLSLEAYDAPVVAHDSKELPLPGRSAQEPAEVAEPEEPRAVEAPAPEIEEAEPVVEEVLATEAAEIEGVSEEPPAAEETIVEEPQAEVATPDTSPSPTGKKLVSLIDELGLDELADPDPVDAAPVEVEAAAPVEAPAADPLDETGMSWLDELETESQAATSQEEKIFDEEDDFFDLAAELERELTADESDGDALGAQEQSLEDIIEGFKQGVAENLSPEDYDTHFNLGIAYREMGLLDEAIGEFQLAAKDDRYVVDSSSLLGICFLEKGLPELAVRSYRKGLESPSISEEATLGLLYDMATAYLSLGDSDAAYKTFIEVYGLNSHYRDVSSRIQELKAEG